jgi:hypothetical protein
VDKKLVANMEENQKGVVCGSSWVANVPWSRMVAAQGYNALGKKSSLYTYSLHKFFSLLQLCK